MVLFKIDLKVCPQGFLTNYIRGLGEERDQKCLSRAFDVSNQKSGGASF